MLIIDDPHSGVPVYRQVMDQVKFHIASGMLKPGDRLPSTRTLSAELGVNPMTVSKAYSFLEMEGVVERRPGKPLVVKEAREDALHERKLQQLSDSLQPSVTVVKQLGIEFEEAVQMFRNKLEENTGSPSGSRKEEK